MQGEEEKKARPRNDHPKPFPPPCRARIIRRRAGEGGNQLGPRYLKRWVATPLPRVVAGTQEVRLEAVGHGVEFLQLESIPIPPPPKVTGMKVRVSRCGLAFFFRSFYSIL